MRTFWEGIGLSQAKFGKIAGIPQATINRYETGYSAAPIKVLIWYADYFDVSMDYICCRTEKPQGKLYEYKPKILEEDKDMNSGGQGINCLGLCCFVSAYLFLPCAFCHTANSCWPCSLS